ncbi:hypothetical protein [Faecalibacter rhinopitheci]|uniref:Uncharacterized protein n=1 Tax=Faecalibacter rhinopitheci TaxID=2779678 RepID=A0A8J7KBA9_9FLAO|nr:hypothetical protein [Faecalibacter rhinopitheci]MBF0598405.1 hypothetical protein [Faecalibacter rhinopitheci]
MNELDLDFSGGPNSWFDFWHTHVDWDGEGNKNFKIRLNYLQELLKLYENIKKELNLYPNNYQIWIVIDEKDSSEDAVYIHTKNPNNENFPLKIDNTKIWKTDNEDLSNFILQTGLEIIEVEYYDGKGFYLFDKNIGESIIN